MNNQLKKGVLDLIILAIIKKEPSYGYSIVSQVDKYFRVKESSIYIILQRLYSQQYLSFRQEYNGARKVKVYFITDSGIKYLDGLFADMNKLLKMVNDLKEESNE